MNNRPFALPFVQGESHRSALECAAGFHVYTRRSPLTMSVSAGGRRFSLGRHGSELQHISPVHSVLAPSRRSLPRRILCFQAALTHPGAALPEHWLLLTPDTSLASKNMAPAPGLRRRRPTFNLWCRRDMKKAHLPQPRDAANSRTLAQPRVWLRHLPICSSPSAPKLVNRGRGKTSNTTLINPYDDHTDFQPGAATR